MDLFTILVYLAPCDTSYRTRGAWGGLHVTLTEGFLGTSQDALMLHEKVGKAAAAQRGKWPWFMRHSSLKTGGPGVPSRISITSPTLDQLCENMARLGVAGVRKNGSYHLTLDDVPPHEAAGVHHALTSMHGGGFNLYVAWIPVFLSAAPPAWHVVATSRALQRPGPEFAPYPSCTIYRPGAGVLLLETYNRRTVPQKTGAAFILFHDRHTKRVTDAGGVIDTVNGLPDAPMQTAQRELLEESAGLFDLDLQRAMGREVVVAQGCYHAYVVPIKAAKGIRRDLFDKNRSMTGGMGPSWRETDHMTRFFVDDLVANNVMTAKDHLIGVPDVYGRGWTIDGRTKSAIRQFLLLGVRLTPNNVEQVTRRSPFNRSAYVLM